MPACLNGLGSIELPGHLLQRRPRQQEALLPHLGEPHERLGLVAAALDVEDHTLAPLAVAHVVAHLQPERLGTARRRALRAHGGLDDAVATLARAVPTAAVVPPVVAPARAGAAGRALAAL